MKRKAFKILTGCILLSLLLSGCGGRTGTDTPGAEIDHMRSLAGMEDYDIPEEAIQRLQTALEAEPVTVPAEEWTMDTICQAVCINGRNLTVPCTLSDLGEGFEILEDDAHNFVYNEERHTAVGYLSFYGKPVAVFMIEDCESADDVPDAPLKTLLFYTKPADGDQHDIIYPIAVNGVTLGSSASAVKERLYFMDTNIESKETDYYHFVKRINDNFSIACDLTGGEVTMLSVYFDLD